MKRPTSPLPPVNLPPMDPPVDMQESGKTAEHTLHSSRPLPHHNRPLHRGGGTSPSQASMLVRHEYDASAQDGAGAGLQSLRYAPTPPIPSAPISSNGRLSTPLTTEASNPERALSRGVARGSDTAPTRFTSPAYRRHVANVHTIGTLQPNDKLWAADGALRVHRYHPVRWIVRNVCEQSGSETISIAAESVQAVIGCISNKFTSSKLGILMDDEFRGLQFASKGLENLGASYLLAGDTAVNIRISDMQSRITQCITSVIAYYEQLVRDLHPSRSLPT